MTKAKRKQETALKKVLHRAAKIAVSLLPTKRCCTLLNVVGSIVICYFLMTIASIINSSHGASNDIHLPVLAQVNIPIPSNAFIQDYKNDGQFLPSLPTV